jgi:ribosomal-protein-alanine N-acetyltransferase
VISIRQVAAPLSHAEAEALSALHRRAFEAEGENRGRGWSASEFAVLAEAPGALLFVAGAPSAPLGLALFRVAADEAELLTIAADSGQRRRGVAESLLSAGRALLRDMDVAKVFLEVGAANAPAISLYKKAGFRKIAMRKDYYAFSDGGHDDALIYSFEII